MQTGKQGNNVYKDSNELSRTRFSLDPTFCATWGREYPKKRGDKINDDAKFGGKVTTFGLNRVVERSALDFR